MFKTLDIALEAYPGASPIIHSDRGYQYTSNGSKQKLDAAEMTHSMSRVGRCIDYPDKLLIPKFVISDALHVLANTQYGVLVMKTSG